MENKNIDSNNREDIINSSTSDFKYVLQQPVDVKDLTLMKMSQLLLANTFYSVRKGFNQTFTVTYNSIVKQIVIDEGSYTSTSLASLLEFTLNANFGLNSFTVGFDENLDVLIIEASLDFIFDFSQSTDDNFTFRLLGFKQLKVYNSVAKILMSEFSPRLRDQYIFLDITIDTSLGQKLYIDNNSNKYSLQIPVIGEFRDNIFFYNTVADLSLYWFNTGSTKLLNTIYVKVYDQNNQILNLRNGEISFILTFE